ncbi:MAG: F0F1 ATP synthase subunit alpha, partial [Pseudomonadota bacterium]|nr:F0F1 ATP synthase subunit alpha [Pseudomonadota bacterium]
GERLTELLKQAQFSPLKVEEQVIVIYAGVNGYLDGVQTSDVGRFEQGLLETVHTKHVKVLDAIRAEKALSDTTEAALKDIVDAYAGGFA